MCLGIGARVLRIGMNNWKQRLKTAANEVYVISLAARDSRVPWYAKVLALCVAGYAFSPIDLIPDFIPIVGYLDDLLIVPLGVLLVVRIIPKPVLDEYRREVSNRQSEEMPQSWVAAVLIIIVWLLIAFLIFTLWRSKRGQ